MFIFFFYFVNWFAEYETICFWCFNRHSIKMIDDSFNLKLFFIAILYLIKNGDITVDNVEENDGVRHPITNFILIQMPFFRYYLLLYYTTQLRGFSSCNNWKIKIKPVSVLFVTGFSFHIIYLPRNNLNYTSFQNNNFIWCILLLKKLGSESSITEQFNF